MLSSAEAWGQEADIKGSRTTRTDVNVIPFLSLSLTGRYAPWPPVCRFLCLVNKTPRAPPWTRLWPVATVVCLYATTQTANTQTYIHAPSGDRTHDPCVQTVEDSTAFGLLNVAQRQL
jgi:hypothetical protein